MLANATRLAGTVLLFVGLVQIPSASAEHFSQTLSGWGHAIEDGNGDGVLGESITLESGDGVFGPAVTNIHAELEPEPSGTCASIFTQKFRFVSWTAVSRYDNGDLLMHAFRWGYVCKFNLAGLSGPFYSFTVSTDIVGGTGRFWNATGKALLTGSEMAMGSDGIAKTHTCHFGKLEGDVVLTPLPVPPLR